MSGLEAIRRMISKVDEMTEPELKTNEFEHNGYIYSLHFCDYNSEESGVYRCDKWNNKGQLVDTFTITANTYKEAKERIIGA